jgi:hypothetical protein
MQCVNCGFWNMPGSESCGRCNTSLTIATAVMDVNPPRAGPMRKRIRRVLPVSRVYYRTRDALHGDVLATHARNAMEASPPLPIFIRLVFPGWTHFYLKQPIRGHLFLWSFVGCLTPAILLFGSGWGSFWLGMAFSVHSSAALDVVQQTFADAGTRERIGRSIMVSLFLFVFIYLPIGFVIHALAQPHTVMTIIPPFAAGDVIVVNRWARLRRGDVVLYDFNYVAVAGQVNREQNYHHFEGENIDRILAVPGDDLMEQNGELFINGAKSKFMPLNAVRVPAKLKMKLQQDQFLIVPSGPPGINASGNMPQWAEAGRVARDSIAGVAYLQTSPLSRFHVIH